uniref:Orf109 n=1 Tax=Eruca vesicaria subsp. sativa TaxID=29727 RepID=A0A088BEV1_ERUVS|nr:orf109 [Eruca vesicaria subsp. sativa]
MIDLGMYTFDSLWRYGSRMSTALELEFCSASQTTHHVGIIVHLPSVILNFFYIYMGATPHIHIERGNQYSKYWRLSEELDSFGNYLPPDYIPSPTPSSPETSLIPRPQH